MGGAGAASDEHVTTGLHPSDDAPTASSPSTKAQTPGASSPTVAHCKNGHQAQGNGTPQPAEDEDSHQPHGDAEGNDTALEEHAPGEDSHTRSRSKKRKLAAAHRSKGRGTQWKKRVRVEHFPVGSMLMNEMMACVMAEARKNSILHKSLFQVSIWAQRLCTSSGGCS